jgi:transcriptional regulator with XRE-family HTH domain
VHGNSLSQNELAKLLGCSVTFLSNWKNGKKDIKVSTAKKWAKVLNVEPADLLLANVAERPRLLGLNYTWKSIFKNRGR